MQIFFEHVTIDIINIADNINIFMNKFRTKQNLNA